MVPLLKIKNRILDCNFFLSDCVSNSALTFAIILCSPAARTLHRVLEWRNHKVVWPHVTVPIVEVVNVILKRINEASVSFFDVS